MRIRDMPVDERPSARLRRFGPASLSDSELLSIVLGGDKGLIQARTHLAEGLYQLSRKERSTAKLDALFELTRRIRDYREGDRDPIKDAASIAVHLIARYSHYLQERLGGIFLDSKNRILFEREIYVGTLNATTVSTRDVLRIALESHAAAVLVFHNHPSGDPSPSPEDLVFTRKLAESTRLLGVDLVDHLIIGANRFVSLRQRGTI